MLVTIWPWLLFAPNTVVSKQFWLGPLAPISVRGALICFFGSRQPTRVFLRTGYYNRQTQKVKLLLYLQYLAFGNRQNKSIVNSVNQCFFTSAAVIRTMVSVDPHLIKYIWARRWTCFENYDYTRKPARSFGPPARMVSDHRGVEKQMRNSASIKMEGGALSIQATKIYVRILELCLFRSPLRWKMANSRNIWAVVAPAQIREEINIFHERSERKSFCLKNLSGFEKSEEEKWLRFL